MSLFRLIKYFIQFLIVLLFQILWSSFKLSKQFKSISDLRYFILFLKATKASNSGGYEFSRVLSDAIPLPLVPNQDKEINLGCFRDPTLSRRNNLSLASILPAKATQIHRMSSRHGT